jgi:hypothetical protein
MDGVRDHQGIVTFRQRVFKNVSLHDLDARALGLAGQLSWLAATPLTRANGNERRAGNISALKAFSRCGILTGGGSNAAAWRFGYSVGEADHSHHAEEGCETAEKIR